MGWGYMKCITRWSPPGSGTPGGGCGSCLPMLEGEGGDQGATAHLEAGPVTERPEQRGDVVGQAAGCHERSVCGRRGGYSNRGGASGRGGFPVAVAGFCSQLFGLTLMTTGAVQALTVHRLAAVRHLAHPAS